MLGPMGRRRRRRTRDLWERMTGHELMLRAAGIAFYSELALIPLLLLGTSLIGYLLGSSDQALHEVMRLMRRAVPPGSSRAVEDFLRTLVHSRHVTGLLGIGSLLWIAMGVFEVIASSLTALTGGQETRSYLRRKLIALVLMGSIGFLVLAALLASWALAAWPRIEELIGVRIVLPTFLGDPGFAHYATSGLLALFLALVYRVAPVRTIRWPAILTAAAAAGLLWHVARLAFNYYLAHLARYNLVYGILGGVVGLLLWIFYSSLILLLGGVLADLLDGGRHADK